MGCTSSAPNNVPPPQANATETEIKEEIRVEESNQLQTVATIELPKCDTVNQVDVAMIASNNESSMKIESPLLEPKDDHKHGLIQPEMTEIVKIDEAKQIADHDEAKINNAEEKMTNMEEVVEKVVEVYVAASTLSNFSNTASIQSTSVSARPGKGDNDNKTAELNNEMEQEENEEEELGSLVSPSQSQSSRATRWEALADIAAELPPSLTVDPLTGQIYALSK